MLKFAGRVEGGDNDGGGRRAGEAAVLGEDGLLVREEDQVVRRQGLILHVSSNSLNLFRGGNLSRNLTGSDRDATTTYILLSSTLF